MAQFRVGSDHVGTAEHLGGGGGVSVITIGQNTTDTYAGIEDTDVRDDGGAINGNFHTDTTCYVSKYASGDYRTNLIRATGLSNITPDTVTVTAATLKYKIDAGSIDPIDITLRRMLRPWVVSEATGNIYSTGNSWTSVMGVGNGTDRSSTVTLTQSVDLDFGSGYKSFTSAQFIADVQDMIDVPSSNHGWDQECTGGADDTRYRRFISSNGADGDRPLVEVTHTMIGAGGGTSRHMTLLGVG